MNLVVEEYDGDLDLDFNPTLMSTSSYIASEGVFFIEEVSFGGQPGTEQSDFVF